MVTDKRPNIEIELTQTDRLLEGLALAGLAVLLALPVAYYAELPDTIPIHFNGKGEADGFGHKSTIWLMPGIGLALFALLTVVNRKSSNFNYPVRITPENAESQYRLGTRMIRMLKVLIMILFAWICWAMIQGAQSENPSIGAGFIWIILGGVFGTLGWYMWAAYREK